MSASLLERKIIYLTIYAAADTVLKALNPCKIQKDSEGHCSCIDTRRPNGWPTATLCCGGCPHLGPEGCTVQALACKVWTCGTLKREAPEAATILKHLERAAIAANIPLPIRSSIEESFRGE